ncbi:MAG: biopolymer transporter ExbD [Bacteroidetes bacterium]|nr:biopolymer transporter ExbD [Bacteroidota bacterium]
MAFKPSQRRTVKIESTELDLRPIMNMMCILIPLLLSCSQFVKNSWLELNLPPVGGGPSPNNSETQDKPKEEPKKVGLKLVITEKGMTLAGNTVILAGEGGAGPTLPKLTDGRYDFDGLDKKIKDIVKTIGGKGFEDERVIIITAEDGIEYQSIVTTMDVLTLAATKELKDQAGKVVKEPWFVNIGVGKILI